jgi:hypothetical protein
MLHRQVLWVSANRLFAQYRKKCNNTKSAVVSNHILKISVFILASHYSLVHFAPLILWFTISDKILSLNSQSWLQNSRYEHIRLNVQQGSIWRENIATPWKHIVAFCPYKCDALWCTKPESFNQLQNVNIWTEIVFPNKATAKVRPR